MPWIATITCLAINPPFFPCQEETGERRKMPIDTVGVSVTPRIMECNQYSDNADRFWPPSNSPAFFFARKLLHAGCRCDRNIRSALSLRSHPPDPPSRRLANTEFPPD